MSHIARTTFQFQDLDALEQACRSFGFELIRNQKTFHYFGSHEGQCDHVIKTGGRYDIGVSQSGDHYNLLWDASMIGRDVLAKVSDSSDRTRGYNHDRLNQAYTTQVTVNQLEADGFRVTTWTNDLGEVIIEAEQ